MSDLHPDAQRPWAEYRRFLLGVLLQKCGGNVALCQEADDLIQETLARAVEHFRSAPELPEVQLLAWLQVTMRHRVVDWIRHRDVIARTEAPFAAAMRREWLDPLESLVRAETEERLQLSVGRLAEADRLLIDSFLLDEPLRALGGRLGITENAAQKRRSVSIARLCDLYQNGGGSVDIVARMHNYRSASMKRNPARHRRLDVSFGLSRP